MDDVDAELGVLEPLPPHGAFLRPVGARGRFRVSRPEHDHVAVLQAVLDRAVGLRLADPQRVAPVMHGAPVPAFPGIRVVVHARHADRIGEAEQRREVVADIAPGMMRAVRERDGARAMLALLPLDLGGDERDRLFPGDAHIAGLAAVLRIALAVRIEVDALHRVEQPVGRIDDRFGVLPMRRQRGLGRRREVHAARRDGPGLRIVVVEIDRRHAHDLAVLDVDEHRPAIGHVAIPHGAVFEPGAELRAGGLAHHQGLGEPVGQVLGAIDRENEVLLGVDLVEPVDRRRQQLGAPCRVLEHELDVGARVQAGPGADPAVPDGEPASGFLVARHDLRHQIALFEPGPEGGMAERLELEQLRQAEQDERKLDGGDGHVVLRKALAIILILQS